MLLRAEIEALHIVQMENGSAPPPGNFDRTSYNLRLGREFCLVGRDNRRLTVNDCGDGVGILILPPFACALVSSEEIIRLPDDVAGRWGLKIRPAMSGLLFQAGPQIEPGSFTRLYGLLFNLSSSEKQLHYRDKMWSVDFVRLSGSVPGLTVPTQATLDMTAYTSNGLPSGSLSEIYEDYERLQKENSARREVVIGIALALVVLISSTLLPVVVAKTVYDRSDISDLVRSTEESKAQTDAVVRESTRLADEIADLRARLRELEQAQAPP